MASQPISTAYQSEWWRLPRVLAETGLSRATIYRRMAEGSFPKNQHLRTSRGSIWFEHEVRAWKRRELGLDDDAQGIEDLL